MAEQDPSPRPPAQRMYQLLWEMIRDNPGQTIEITCPDMLRIRIRKAVYKERQQDRNPMLANRFLRVIFVPGGIQFRMRGRLVRNTGIEIFSGMERMGRKVILSETDINHIHNDNTFTLEDF